MRITKQLMWLVAAVTVSAGAVSAAYRLTAAEVLSSDDPPPAKAGDDERQVKKTMMENARKVFESDRKRHQEGQQPLGVEEQYLWSIRWLEAELDLATDVAEKTGALKAHVDRMKGVEKIATTIAQAGQGRERDAVAARYYSAQAELWVTRGRTK